MSVLIIIFGALTLLAGIVIVINPEIIFGVLIKHRDKLELHILAIVVRLMLGGLLIYQSSASKFPFAVEIIGWLSVVAAIFLAVIGRRKFKNLMSWAGLQQISLKSLNVPSCRPPYLGKMQPICG
jgi:hypothetical protein